MSIIQEVMETIPKEMKLIFVSSLLKIGSCYIIKLIS